MKKISQVLKETEIPQITGYYIDFDNNKELIGKCALGALACEKGLLGSRGSEDDVSYQDIIGLYGADPYTMIKMPKSKAIWVSEQTMPLSTVLFRLNDNYKWSFKKIGKFIEKLEKKGVIKYAKN